MTSEERPSPPEKGAAAGGSSPAAAARRMPLRVDRRQLMRLGVAGLILLPLRSIVPRLRRALSTVSTDDAYVSGHVTFVAPRVAGQVAAVLVDDNNRVRKGDVLVALDPITELLELRNRRLVDDRVDPVRTVLRPGRATVDAQLVPAHQVRHRVVALTGDRHSIASHGR